ncbi:MAG: peptidylprolyl isomerase [Deltaproteobacteria bacterium]|nr:peptidylprolyl isomerase [Deltaproteobacteria bacterium]
MLLKIIRSFWLLIFISVLFPACDFLDNSKRNVVITVGSREITENELKEDIRRIKMEMGIPDQNTPRELDLLVKGVIDNYLIMEYGKMKGITLNDIELESAIAEIKGDYPEDVFNEVLIKKYIDYGEWKESIRESLLIKKIIGNVLGDVSPVSLSETKAYFDAHQEEFRIPEMIKLRQIVTKTKDEAEQVLGLIYKGENMSDLAKEYSIAPEAKKGGLVGWIEKGELDESMEKRFFSLEVGSCSRILKTDYGYHIFEVLEKRGPGMRSLPESIAEIEEKLLIEKKEIFFKNWLENFREQIKVDIKRDVYKDWSLD